MRTFLFTALLACTIPALAMSNAERELISASVKNNPRWVDLEVAHTVLRLGRDGDLEALDLLISLNHRLLTEDYLSGYAQGQRHKDPAPLEQRLLAQYDNPPMATVLMGGLFNYASSTVLDRLIDDATRLAEFYASQAARCKIVVVALAKSSPQSVRSASRPKNFGVVQDTQPRLDCADASPSFIQEQERYRMQAAVRMLGKTDRRDVVSRIQPLLGPLTATPVPHDEGASEFAIGLLARQVDDLRSIADIIRRQQYHDAGADLTAIVRKVPAPARTESYLALVWPLMQALGQMDRREGTEAIAEWIEWRSTREIDAATRPTVDEMIQLLGPVIPEAQIDIGALRDRVMPRIPEAHRYKYETAFDAAEKQNRKLRGPGKATLIEVARQHDPRLVRYVLSRGITPNEGDFSGETALTAAAGNTVGEYREVIRILIDAGADPDGRGRYGLTPFLEAVRSFSPSDIESYKMVDIFYTKGVDVNHGDGGGTALVSAAKGSTEMVKYLLERGARPDIAGPNGLTPLHAAARAAKAESVKQLLAAGARVGAKDRDEHTPLHYAVLSKSVESAELLLKAGADVNAEVQGGLTPLLMAQDNQDSAMAAVLKRYGGRVNFVYEAKRAAWVKLFGRFYDTAFH